MGTSLKSIYDHDCKLCPLHDNEGTTCISGSGNYKSPKVLIVNDAPAREEVTGHGAYTDQRAKLVREALEEVGLEVSFTGDIYGTYLCKCFPAGKLKTVDARVCAEKYLLREIAFFKPALILALGKNAQLILLHNSSPISKTHGKIFDAEFEIDGDTITTKVMPVDHPFAILSSPSKFDPWLADLARAKAVLYDEGEPFWTPEKVDRFDFQVIESIPHFLAVARNLIDTYKGQYLAIDVEASGLDQAMPFSDFKVYTLQFGIVDLEHKEENDTLPVYILPIQSEQFGCTGKDKWVDKLQQLLNNFLHPRYFKLIAHNGKYDLKALRKIGVNEAYLYWDTIMLWANVHGEAPMSLKEIAYQVSDLGGYEVLMDEYFKEHDTYDAPPEILVPYGGLDVVVTRHLMFQMAQSILLETEV